MEFRNWLGAWKSPHRSEFVEATNAESFLNLLGGVVSILNHIKKCLISASLFVLNTVQG